MTIQTLPAGAGHRHLRIETAELVPVRLVVAGAGERFVALLIDAVLMIAVLLAVGFLAVSIRSLWLLAVTVAAFFALRVFYFVLFESGPRAATPGKRLLGLRVVRADGGPLSVEAVLARNFTRELELFAPLIVLIYAAQFWPGHSGLARLLAAGWVLAIATMPLWSPSRVRLGDLIAGTRVVRLPRATLLADLSRRVQEQEQPDRPDRPDRPAAETTFSPAQLAIYGIRELQVLEEVLRRSREPGGSEAVAAVSKRIRGKIGYDVASQGELADVEFLRRFYAAQRRHLEQELLFGRRKERRRD